jgi:hypothetical protein
VELPVCAEGARGKESFGADRITENPTALLLRVGRAAIPRGFFDPTHLLGRRASATVAQINIPVTIVNQFWPDKSQCWKILSNPVAKNCQSFHQYVSFRAPSEWTTYQTTGALAF